MYMVEHQQYEFCQGSGTRFLALNAVEHEQFVPSWVEHLFLAITKFKNWFAWFDKWCDYGFTNIVITISQIL